ncbi:AraC family transcriptional regulator [Marinibaculum pumilum]|uniref:AraC family transcriptional regulator n=1 Tax=Marinibaculum pumilum TaxID=1766165 RepID=A0ABV7L8J9_9PROT
MAQRQTIIETWFAAVLAQFARLGINLDDPTWAPDRSGRTAAPRYLQLVHARRLWHQACDRCPDPYLGLKVGRALPLQAMNILGVIVMHSGSLREALAHIVRYHSLISNSGDFHLRRHAGGGATLQYEVRDCVVPMHPAQLDSVFAGAIAHLSRCMPELAGRYRVELPGTGPQHEEGYAGYLGCPVALGSERGRLHFAEASLDRPWPGADAQLLAAACEMADQRLRALGHTDDLLDQVRALLAASLPGRTSLPQVADALDMSRRSLQRRLGEAGTSYRQLVEAARLERALELLRSSERSHYEIAEMVGYAEPGALAHVTRRHLGKTPGQIRQELKWR